MKTSPQLQAVITQLSVQHDLDLACPGACLRLEQPAYHPLVVEVVGQTLVHVAQVQEPPAVPPGIVLGILFFTGYGVWIPVEVTVFNCGYTEVAWLNLDQSDLLEVRPDRQAELAAFADEWAVRLVAHGWLNPALKSTRP